MRCDMGKPPLHKYTIIPTGNAERDAAILEEWKELDRIAREHAEAESSQAKPGIGHPREYADDKIKDIAKGILREQGKQSANILAGKVAWTIENEPQYKNLPCPKDTKLRTLCGEVLAELGMKKPRPPRRSR
jgi:hypothetical protein